MDSPQTIVLIIIGTMLGLLFSGRVRPVTILLSTVALFYGLELIPRKALLGSFTNISILNLMLLLIVSSILPKTELIYFLRKFRWHRPQKMTKFLALVASMSAFLSNTLVVSLMIQSLNKRDNLSRILMPISYMAMIAGTITLLGTSTNFIVNGFVMDMGLEPLGLFQFSWIGIPLALAGILYLVLLAPRLLPKQDAPTDSQSAQYFLEVEVLENSNLLHKTIKHNQLRKLENLFLAEIVREGQLITPVSPNELILPHDILVFTGDVDNIKDLQKFTGLRVFNEKHSILNNNLVWVVLSQQSDLLGKTIRDVNFRSEFDAAVVAIRRGRERLSGKLGTIHLQAGDELILAVGNDFQNRSTVENHFYIVDNLHVQDRFNLPKTLLALALFGITIFMGTQGSEVLFKSLLALLWLYYLLGFLVVREIKQAIHLELFMILGASLALSKVLLLTGTAEMIASGLLQMVNASDPYGALAAIYLLTVLLTLVVTNNAVAALALPIAYSTATHLQVNPLPFIFAVAYGASASFLSPYAYQTNTMVYSIGGYQPKDFLRLGLGLSIIYATIVLLLLPIIFPF